MRLLQPLEREISYKKEKDFTRAQATELSNEITNIVKSFNKTKTELEINKGLVLKDYNEFRDEIDEKRRLLEEEVRILENKRDNALLPLYEKEKQLQKKESHLSNLEDALCTRESNIKVREKDLKDLKSVCDAIISKVDQAEKDIKQREFSLERRQAKFDKFMHGQRKLLEENEQKLRNWLEAERAKLKNAKANNGK